MNNPRESCNFYFKKNPRESCKSHANHMNQVEM